MKFIQYYSGSKGNLYEVTTANGSRLLIDPGVTWPNMQKALNYNLDNIQGALCSHEHQDHSKGVKDLIKNGVDIYTAFETAEALDLDIPQRRLNIIEPDRIFSPSLDIQVYPFEIQHDAAMPLGFVIKADNEYLLYVTDTSHIKQRFNWPFSIIAIECSYDSNTLQSYVEQDKLNEAAAKRLLYTHMAKQETIRYIKEFCNLSICREIHLIHMSGNNIDKKKAAKDFSEVFMFIDIKIFKDNFNGYFK